jgi:hypothetical protein
MRRGYQRFGGGRQHLWRKCFKVTYPFIGKRNDAVERGGFPELRYPEAGRSRKWQLSSPPFAGRDSRPYHRHKHS